MEGGGRRVRVLYTDLPQREGGTFTRNVSLENIIYIRLCLNYVSAICRSIWYKMYKAIISTEIPCKIPLH